MQLCARLDLPSIWPPSLLSPLSLITQAPGSEKNYIMQWKYWPLSFMCARVKDDNDAVQMKWWTLNCGSMRKIEQ